jgi:hypothetical protein
VLFAQVRRFLACEETPVPEIIDGSEEVRAAANLAA